MGRRVEVLAGAARHPDCSPCIGEERVMPSPSPDTVLEKLRQAAAACTACDLYKRATQTVFGEGNAKAAIVLLGEQPGHEEDLAGRPFVGPAGRLLDEALAQAGLDRRRLYVTNAVKHFKWKPGAVSYT